MFKNGFYCISKWVLFLPLLSQMKDRRDVCSPLSLPPLRRAWCYLNLGWVTEAAPAGDWRTWVGNTLYGNAFWWLHSFCLKKVTMFHSLFVRIPNFFLASIFLNFSDFEPRTNLHYSKVRKACMGNPWSVCETRPTESFNPTRGEVLMF